MGLTLNPSKCELIAHQDLSVKDDCLLSFVRVNVSDATLLGAPLFDKAWTNRCAELARAVDRLDAVSSQDALITGCAVAPALCTRRLALSMGDGIFDPPQNSHPLTDHQKIWYR